MATLPKMTQEDKDGLIALHMAMRTVDRHSADSALVHLVSLSKKAEELCRWLEELGLLDEDMWWEVCSDNVEGNF